MARRLPIRAFTPTKKVKLNVSVRADLILKAEAYARHLGGSTTIDHVTEQALEYAIQADRDFCRRYVPASGGEEVTS